MTRDVVDALWQYLETHGWRPEADSLTGKIVGARKPGAQNDTVASCETGYCKTEFSLAHVADLFELEASISALRLPWNMSWMISLIRFSTIQSGILPSCFS